MNFVVGKVGKGRVAVYVVYEILAGLTGEIKLHIVGCGRANEAVRLYNSVAWSMCFIFLFGVYQFAKVVIFANLWY